jgi:hypothetical protein
MAQADKICRRVDPTTGPLPIEEFPQKPPRMRWSTYWRLEERQGRQRDRWTMEFFKRLGFWP